MFIQQPIRVVATPTTPQHNAVMIDTLLRLHYTERMNTMTTPRVTVMRLDVLNPLLLGASTQVDLMISVEAETLEDFQQYIQSFVKREETDDFEVVSVGYTGL